RTAIDTLPVKAQAQKPWPKAMSSIHEAIKAP
ncbi:MAG: septal ring-binding cell division protein DamX, partial [Gammaproteobacteria bacterium]